MTLAVRAAVDDDIPAVFADLSDISRAEYAAAEIDLWYMHRLLARRVCHDGGFTLTHDGSPIAVFGFLPFAGDLNSWFVASEAFFRRGRATTVFTRRWLAAHFKELGRPVYCTSTSPHPDAARWLELVGFRVREAGNGHILSQGGVLESSL